MTYRNIITSLLVMTSALTLPAVVCAMPTSHYATASRLSSGRWVKVKVSHSGVHKISYDDLRRYGFNNPSAVRVYGYSGISLADGTFGVSIPDDLPQQYSEHIGDALFFYAEADCRVRLKSMQQVVTARDYYSRVSYYYLSDEPDNATSELSPARPYEKIGSTLTSHISVDYQEREEICPGSGGTLFFSGKFSDDPVGNTTYTLHTPDAEPGGQTVLMWQGVARTTSTLKINPTLPSSLTRTGNEYIRNISRYDTNYTSEIFFSDLPGTSYVYVNNNGMSESHTVTFATSVKPEWAAMDFVALAYRRNNRLGDNGSIDMLFTSLGKTENILVSEAGADTRVWDVTEPLKVTPLETSVTQENAVEVHPAISGIAAIVAFDPSSDAIPSPEYAGEARATNLHGQEGTADMVIVTTAALQSQAERLAELHRTRQGMTVTVALDTDIYGEFSSGSKSAHAIRRYVKMLNDRNPGKLRYLLLFGHGVFDNRNIIYEDKGYLPVFEVTDNDKAHTIETQIYCSDNFFGMLADDFTFSTMPRQEVNLAVGRIPAADITEATVNVDKIESYFDSYGVSDDFLRIHSMADRGDKNAHQQMGDNTVRRATETFRPAIATKAFNDLYPDANIGDMTQLTMNTLAGGVGLVTFAGHTSYSNIGTAELSSQNVPGMNFGNRPLMVLATCGSIFIDRLSACVGDKLNDHATGPIGIVGAGRSVYLNRNAHVLYNMTEQYFSLGDGDCLGDAWMRAYNNILRNTDISTVINTLSYNYVGDPAVPSGRPGLTCDIREVNGVAAGQSTVSAEPFSRVTLKGVITDADGNFVDDFNGDITVTVMERPTFLKTLGKDRSDTIQNIRLEQDILAKGAGRAVKGEWSAEVFVPQPSVAGDAFNRVIVAAHTNYSNRLGVGQFEGLSISADASNTPTGDTTGPEITEFYLDSPDFANGDGVMPDINITVKVASDPSGIRLNGSGLGQHPSLVLDNTSVYRDIRNSLRIAGDGSATLNYAIKGLSTGTHSLTFTVYDNLGNKSTRTISFVVVNNSVNATLTAEEYMLTPEADGLTIDLSAASSIRAGRLIIVNGSGETVFTKQSPQFPLTWKPEAGLPDGPYRVRATLVNGTKRGVTPDLRLIIKRK